jgi:hypothetical protein
MFHSLLATQSPQVAQGYSVTNNNLYSRISTGIAATDSALQYMGHVDIPPGPLSGLTTDWRARFTALYESGTYGGVTPDDKPTATTNLERRFNVRIGTIDGSDPTNPSNTIAVAAPAEYATSIGGQFSVTLAAVAGSGGNDVRISAMYAAQSEYLQSAQALNHWYDQYSTNGLRVVVFFSWENTYVAGKIMKVVSSSLEVVPGTSTTLVNSTAPRTLTSAMFGAHWHRWPQPATTATVPLGVNYGAVRSLNYDGPTGNNLAAMMHFIEKTNWLPLTSAQRQSTAGDWSVLDYFVARHAGKRMIIPLYGQSGLHSAVGAINTPPVDLANNTTGSWYIACREIALRYAGQGIHYEIYNEPYPTVGTGPFVNYASARTTFIGFTGTPAELSQMVVQAAEAIRSVDSSAKIIGPSFINVINRGSAAGADYVRACLSANSNAMINAVDYIGYHTYPINIGNALPSPLAAYGFTRNLRSILTQLGFPTKPLYMTEMTSENPNYASLATPTRLAYMQRSVITLLLGDPYHAGIVWYGFDNGVDFFTQSDADTWNTMIEFLTSGPITRCTINQNGTVSVTIGATSRVY